MRWNTYPGEVDTVTYDRVPAFRFTPGANGYARFVTQETFVPPVRMAGWMQLRKWSGNRTPDSAVFDGLHLHAGHVGNGRNYVASLVRRDGHAKIAAEYGWRGYTTLKWQSAGPELVTDRVYLFDLVWTDTKILTTVSSEAGVWSMAAKIPKDRRIPAGSVGFRLDNFVGVGDVTIKEP